MIEKVNPSHPDKVADRIAGAMVDLAYKKEKNPKVAVEVLIGHGICHIISESSVKFTKTEVRKIVERIAGKIDLDLVVVPQDVFLAANQKEKIKCGDNGIFKGVPLTGEQKEISKRARKIYKKFPYDGKYILDNDRFIICQSNATNSDLRKMYNDAIINPLGIVLEIVTHIEVLKIAVCHKCVTLKRHLNHCEVNEINQFFALFFWCLRQDEIIHLGLSDESGIVESFPFQVIERDSAILDGRSHCLNNSNNGIVFRLRQQFQLNRFARRSGIHHVVMRYR